MSMPNDATMINAVLQCDDRFDDQFIYAVITTGVCCKPSCRSRAPKPENLRFFGDLKSAMSAGFRPCKRCKPAGHESRISTLVDLARYMETNAGESLTLEHLAERAQLSPSHLQRSFKQTFGISPKRYHDALRLRLFRKSLKQGESVTDAIYASGYGSVSRVYGEATRNIGMTPRAYRNGGEGEAITWACRESALGRLMMAATDKGVCFVQFGEDEPQLLAMLESEFPRAQLIPSCNQSSSQLDDWMAALDQHISHNAPKPELPLDIRGTAFQMKVWQFLLSIREGDVMSYSEVAAGIEQPRATRAVASAIARNRIGVLIPCHRVLRGDGSLGGYRWGPERKRVLLDCERQTHRLKD